MHDPRVGRFFATDPLESKYPWYSPYQFGGNSPIMSVELEGLEESKTANENQKQETVGKSSSFNATFFGTTDLIVNPTKCDFVTKESSFNVLSNYGRDPAEEGYVNMLSDKFLDVLKDKVKKYTMFDLDPKAQIKALDKFGFNLKQADEIMDFYKQPKGFSPFEVLVSVAGLATNDKFLENFPVIGGIVKIFNDKFEEDKRTQYNMYKWDFVRKSKTPTSLLNFEDVANVVFIYSDKNLLNLKDVRLENKNNQKLGNRNQEGTQYNFLNVGAQFGENIYIFNSFKLK